MMQNIAHCPHIYLPFPNPTSRRANPFSYPWRYLLAQNLEILLLHKQQTISLLQRNSMSRIFIIRRKSGWMRTLGHLTTDDFLKGIDALSRWVEGVHEMHFDGVGMKSSRCGRVKIEESGIRRKDLG